MTTEPAKPSPLGEPYHYHELGDGPDVNTTDSAEDDGPHDHGIATGILTAIATGKATGEGHAHQLPNGLRLLHVPDVGEQAGKR